jgi:hypothetical protein
MEWFAATPADVLGSLRAKNETVINAQSFQGRVSHKVNLWVIRKSIIEGLLSQA